MNSIRGLLVSALVLVAFAMAHCQLTFSPYWGKRSGGANGGAFEPLKGTCKNANEILVEIFRFIQTQAQSFVECSHKE